MFTPKWKSDAKHLVKGALKFLHYKRDLLDDKRLREIESRRQDLIEAIKAGDRKQVEEASKQLSATCENSLPRQAPQNWFEENVEVMFVAIVIALGLRAYYLQPFRIPTGSMQPTLNGITGTPKPKDQWPSLAVQAWEKVTRGRSYTRIVAKHDLELRVAPSTNKDVPLMTEIQDVQRFHFFSRSMLRTVDGEIIQLPAPANPIYHAGLSAALADAVAKQGPGRMTGMVRIPAGTVLCEGYIDTGDLVLVNKFAYHFRKPQRGEVFVFDTLGIHEIARQSGDQARGAHYIKRLCGVPGDSLSIQSPHLLVNGKIAREPGIVQVADAKGPYAVNPQGYISASSFDRLTPQLKLRDEAAPGLREYAALGDNTDNSLDSRYWGSVKEFNLVGPALFSLWPFTTGHWGFIR